MRKRKINSEQQFLEKIERKKIINDIDFKRSQISFTLNEKKSFSKAISENGFNIIYDIIKLKNYLPERSETEIKYLINIYDRKAKSKQLSLNNDEDKQTPLEIWFNLCDNLIRSSIKKEDTSFLLVDLMNKLYNEENSKYGSIYKYLEQLMEGKYPEKLNGHESIIFLSLLDILTNLIESQNLTTEREIILNLYKNLIDKKKNYLEDEETIYLNFFENINQNDLNKKIQEAINQLNSCENRFNKEKIIDNKNNPLYYYSFLPKIKKIKECLNPLNVPIEILKKQNLDLLNEKLLNKN